MPNLSKKTLRRIARLGRNLTGSQARHELTATEIKAIRAKYDIRNAVSAVKTPRENTIIFTKTKWFNTDTGSWGYTGESKEQSVWGEED